MMQATHEEYVARCNSREIAYHEILPLPENHVCVSLEVRFVEHPIHNSMRGRHVTRRGARMAPTTAPAHSVDCVWYNVWLTANRFTRRDAKCI